MQAAATYRALRLLAWTGGLPAAGWDEKAAAAVELLLQETGRVTADRWVWRASWLGTSGRVATRAAHAAAHSL